MVTSVWRPWKWFCFKHPSSHSLFCCTWEPPWQQSTTPWWLAGVQLMTSFTLHFSSWDRKKTSKTTSLFEENATWCRSTNNLELKPVWQQDCWPNNSGTVMRSSWPHRVWIWHTPHTFSSFTSVFRFRTRTTNVTDTTWPRQTTINNDNAYKYTSVCGTKLSVFMWAYHV